MKESIETARRPPHRLLRICGVAVVFAAAVTGGRTASTSQMDQLGVQAPLLSGGMIPAITPIGGAGTANSQVAASQFPAVSSSSASTDWVQIPFVARTVLTPPSRYGAGLAYDEAHGLVVVFGGIHYELVNGVWTASMLGDTWTWDGHTWAEQHPSNSPPPRFYTSSAYDPRLQKVVLFGGESFSSGVLNDTWVWDGSNWSQLNPANSPVAHFAASLAYDPEHQQMVLFGGLNSVAVANDTWIFDGSSWSLAPSPLSPSPRAGDNSLMTYVPANHGLVLFGGSAGLAGNYNDTWLWNGITWLPLTPASSPPASASPALVYNPVTGTALLYRQEGDTWIWDGQNWQQSPALSPPGPRHGPIYVYDSAVGKVLMYSGAGFLPLYDDEYLWDGNSWTQMDLGDRFPPQRTYNNQMALDAARNKSVLFSGVRDGASYLRDTWIWDGSAWQWLHPATTPPARAWASMAYDSDHGVTVLFGGRKEGGTIQLNDTWTFDGLNWSAQSPQTSPSAREGAPTAFDSVSRKVVLFGGATLSNTVLNDTWTWDGSSWTQEQPTTVPSTRVYHSIAHDAQGRPVIFGGTSDGAAGLSDAWRWNGTTGNWEQLPGGPPGRFGAFMAYDARSGNIILFGGHDHTTSFNDTWAFDGNQWQILNPSTAPSGRTFAAACDSSSASPPLLMGGGNYVGPENAEAWTWGPPIPPVQVTGVVSRMAHGAAGTFNVDLTNGAGIECRSGVNGSYTLVFTFANPLASVGGAGLSSGTGSVASSNIDTTDAHNYIVNLTGIANAQIIAISLANVTDSAGNFSGAVSIQMGVLLGDVNASGRVDAADVSAVRQQTLQNITSSNFRNDINASGRIDAGDVSIARQQTLTSLP